MSSPLYVLYRQVGIYLCFARFPVTIINQERKAVSANLSPFDVPDMAERSRFAYWKDMELSMSGSSKNESPAYTTRIVSGTLKGKTPAEALLDMENGVALLHNQLQFLIAKKELDDIVGGEGVKKRVYTASDLCDILRMNKSSIYRFLKRAEIGKEPFTVIKIKSKYCIPVKNFHKFLNI